uniref:Uncharacterized protein n=1 Tax=Glossina austeni TaxID=7395 RepID=A0A1A9VTG6_GLOAU
MVSANKTNESLCLRAAVWGVSSLEDTLLLFKLSQSLSNSIILVAQTVSVTTLIGVFQVVIVGLSLSPQFLPVGQDLPSVVVREYSCIISPCSFKQPGEQCAELDMQEHYHHQQVHVLEPEIFSLVLILELCSKIYVAAGDDDGDGDGDENRYVLGDIVLGMSVRNEESSFVSFDSHFRKLENFII